MKTLTVTQARAGLGKVCERVKKGEQIGIIWGNQVFMLLPVEVQPVSREISISPMTGSYVEKEYGITPKEFSAFKKRQKRKYQRDRQKGGIVSLKGKFNPALLD